MPNLRRDFTKGKMNLDADIRLLPDGEYRRAENVNIINSEGSDVGSITKSFSNKKLTNLDLGENPICLLGYNDEKRNKIFWFVKSDNGCYLLEWDNTTENASYVLIDTRLVVDRVLNLKDDFLITGIGKIITDDVKSDLLLWTDNNIEPCCINTERAKLYGANNFTKEDIYLIKKPPTFIPTLLPLNIAGLTNNMEERFLSFGYQYKFLDGEYSALSTLTNYSFTPKLFDLNYYTLDNKGMVNAFNAVRIGFNTGPKQVTDVRLVVKESNSNNLYAIETFNKVNEGWADNVIRDFTFSNNKIYQVLPENELYRTFDNVPLKAKSLTLIGNMPVFGDYVEGRDLIDSNGNKVYPDYQLSLINEAIDLGSEFVQTFTAPNKFILTNPGIILKKDSKLIFFINFNIDGDASYDNSFFYVLPEDYTSLLDVFASEYFTDFIEIINADIQNSYLFDVPDNWVETVPPTFTYTVVSTIPTFTITPITFTDETDSSTHIKTVQILSSSYVSISSVNVSSSLKTNRDYEIGVVYEDDPSRKTTVITSKYNSIYIPQLYSNFKNRIKVVLNNAPPAWAKRYRFVMKSQPLQYQTIYINKYYNEDFFVWAKLEAENKDKVKVGDIIIVKKGPNVITSPIKIKVLEIKEQIKDFVTGNNDENGNPIIEEAGFYMKIRPEGFSMSFDNYDIHQNSADAKSHNFPSLLLDLFTNIVGASIEEISIPSGSSISLFIKSSRNYNSGWRDATYDVLHYAQRNYATIEEWFNEIIIGKNLYVTASNGVIHNYKDYLSLVRDSSGKLFLRVLGQYSGGSNDRHGYLNAKIVVRSSDGFYVFETEPKLAESDIFYENSQAFDIVDGQHTGNVQDQDLNIFQPAIIDLNFFNCYCQGNGVESYRIRDGFNTKYLNVDLKPSTTLLEEYKQIRRHADLTYGNPYVESTNTNGLNVFNLSTGNFKELDKQDGSVQKLLSRDTDIVVFQEKKTSKVMFNKTALFNADGTSNVSATNSVLGQQVMYLGENGVGTAPESVSVNDYQIYFANPVRGIMQRLSIDGIEEIVTGMVDFFRDLFIAKPKAKKIGGYDPYLNQYLIGFGNEPEQNNESDCGEVINRYQQSEPFAYDLKLNNILGTISIAYNITEGNATIEAIHGRATYAESNVSGEGLIEIPRTSLEDNIVNIIITPVSEEVSYIVNNNCPIGLTSKVVSIVLNDSENENKSITNRYRWSTSPFYSANDIFSSGPITRFSEDIGIEGQGKIPLRNTIVNIQSFKDVANDYDFDIEKCNRILYLVTNVIYTQANIDTIISLATELNLTNNGNIFDANFLFNKTQDDELLYIVWDYRNTMPVAISDVVLIEDDSNVKIINVLANDTFFGNPNILIVNAPTNGTAIINVDNTITYTRTNLAATTDSFDYSISNGTCTSIANISVFYDDGELEPLPNYTAVSIHKNNSETAACNISGANQSIKYIDTNSFASASIISNDVHGLSLAVAGWYSNGAIARHWTGTTFDSSFNC